jgi:peptidyl-prolyl cis-trans isomerase D
MQSRFAIPEQRRASHILIKTQEGADDAAYQAARQRAVDALQRVRGGEDFAEVAREVSEDTSAANGGDLGFFQKGVMAIPFEEAVWAMDQIGSISDVVQTQFGYHVILLTDIQEAHVKSFEEAREEIQREMAFEEAGNVVLEKAEEFAAAVGDRPESFRDEAALRTLVATNTGPIHQDDPVPGIGFNAEVQRALFSLETGEASEPIAIPRGYVVARFLEAAPGGAPPLDQIRDKVTEDLKNERAAEEARRLAREAAGAASAEELRAKGEELGFDVEVAAGVSRGLAVGNLGTSPVLEEAVFRAEVGQVTGPLDLPDGPVVFVVSSRKEVTDEELAAQTPAVRDELVMGRRQQRLASVTRELMETADVVYNSELLQEINSVSSAAPAANPGS